LEVDRVDDKGLHQLGLDDGGGDFEEGFVLEENAALRLGVHFTGKPQGF
jgi:hypothetical protein